MKLKIFKIIFLCLVIVTVVVGVLVAIQYIGMFNNNSQVKNAMTSITEQFDNANTNIVNNVASGTSSTIDVTYKGYKVVRDNRNTCN